MSSDLQLLNGNAGCESGQSGLSDHISNLPEPYYEEPEDMMLLNGNAGCESGQSGLSNHISNLPEPYYEEPEDMMNSSDGVAASNFVIAPHLPPPLPPPAELKPSHRFMRPGHINPFPVGHRPWNMNPPPGHFYPRFGNPHPTLSNFVSRRPFVQSSNIRIPHRPQLHPEIKPDFPLFNARPKVLANLQQLKPRINDSVVQPTSKRNFDFQTSPSQCLNYSSNVHSYLAPTKSMPLPTTHLRKPYLHQTSNQNINVIQASHLNTRKKYPPLVKKIDTLSEGPTWRDKPSNSHNPNWLPFPPMRPNFSQISSAHHKPDTIISSDKNLVFSAETLQLDSGEEIPMTELHKTFLKEKYFHPITKEFTDKYLTGIFNNSGTNSLLPK